MKKLWQKDWQLNVVIEAFETSGDLLLDQMLVESDVFGSLAHAKGLKKSGILSQQELSKIILGLQQIIQLNQQGKFQLVAGDEDIHTKIENYLLESFGEVGKKIHTGRSRNDQVLTAIRLFTNEQLLLIWDALLVLIQTLLVFSKQHEFDVISGYTHTQKAMPSTVGMWSTALVEGLFDSLLSLKSAYELNNQSPLGSAAGYGIPLRIDREYTAKLLGFKKVQANSLYCQNSRGKIEAIILASLISILQDINKFATDVVLFSTSEFGYFAVAKELCTGSSIMPQKKNVDVAELLRSKLHLVVGNYMQMVGLSANLLSGYNRDFQDSKKPLFESLAITLGSLKVATILVNGINVNLQALQKSLTPEIFATHQALDLVAHGMPFRSAYQQAGKDIMTIKFDPISAVKKSTHIGSTGNLGLKQLSKLRQKESAFFKIETTAYCTNKNNLLEKDTNNEK